MSLRRPKPTGWAAFDLQQRQKQFLESQRLNGPSESLPDTLSSLGPSKGFPQVKSLPAKSFSSVILPSSNFLIQTENDCSSNMRPSILGSSSGHCVNKISLEDISGQLKKRYSWADESLIEDILVAVDNDFEKASVSLGAMISDENTENQMDTACAGFESICNGIIHDLTEKDVHPEDLAGQSRYGINACSNDDVRKVMIDEGFRDHQLCGGAEDIKVVRDQLINVPVEPEWEEDDVYLSHRKDAINMIRAAARHSKAATNSFMRGDHYFAQQFSLKARDEWSAAQKLNAKAANEILSMRNANNGLWKLDLHGLHAIEAVHALEERLHMIETRMPFGSLVATNNARVKAEAICASSEYKDEKSDEQDPKQRQISLEVITGKGNHSRGGAAIPAAVRGFLVEKAYRFDDARPGVIMVRPKFRCR